MMAATLRTYFELVRFSHTVFALPFALMAVILAARLPGGPPLDAAGWGRRGVGVLLCMVAARTAAMAFNRLVDRTIDADNPRTAARHLPRGAVGVEEVFSLVVGSSAAFIGATLLFLPNWLPWGWPPWRPGSRSAARRCCATRPTSWHRCSWAWR